MHQQSKEAIPIHATKDIAVTTLNAISVVEWPDVDEVMVDLVSDLLAALVGVAMVVAVVVVVAWGAAEVSSQVIFHVLVGEVNAKIIQQLNLFIC